MSRFGLPRDVIDYPCSDGQPMAETDIHATRIARIEHEIAARQAAEARTAELEARLHGQERTAAPLQEPGT